MKLKKIGSTTIFSSKFEITATHKKRFFGSIWFETRRGKMDDLSFPGKRKKQQDEKMFFFQTVVQKKHLDAQMLIRWQTWAVGKWSARLAIVPKIPVQIPSIAW